MQVVDVPASPYAREMLLQYYDVGTKEEKKADENREAQKPQDSIHQAPVELPEMKEGHIIMDMMCKPG